MDAPEPPLDRLNYFNGQRLEAVDLRLEQEYHLRVRRWLNKSLYAPGIAAGLEVTKGSDSHRLVVSPGLAIDNEGREIILLEQIEVVAVGIPSPTVGVVYGNYLVIHYAETKTAPVEDGCAVRLNGSRGRSSLAWGAPSRIRPEPVVQFQDIWAGETTGQIVLAQVELDGQCEVREIHTSIRKYVVPSKPPVVRPISLEGEKDIDASNPKVLRFHVEGGTAASATLYLRATLFSTLYYTEMGEHTHELDIKLDDLEIADHSHDLGELTTETADAPKFTIYADTDNNDAGEETSVRLGEVDEYRNLTQQVDMTVVVDPKEHSHTIAEGETTELDGGFSINLQKLLTESTAGNFGAPGVAARAGSAGVGASARTYLKDLVITFDGATLNVLGYLQGRDGPTVWTSLGDGTGSDLLVTRGTGAIDLVRLGLDLGPGEHTLTFSVPTGGGQIQYNLYVGG